MTLVYIHGARSTAHSFNYLRSEVAGHHRELTLEYDSACGFARNLAAMQTMLRERARRELFFIGHSLGGIYALHLAHTFAARTRGAVTLATPYGGVSAALALRWMVPGDRLMWEIGPTDAPIAAAARMAIEWPWTNVVSVRGHNNLILEPNDGVVSLASMRRRSDMALVDVATSHYEIMQHPDAVAIVRRAVSWSLPLLWLRRRPLRSLSLHRLQ